MKFVFFHGSFVGPGWIWWPYLKKELKKINQPVITPQFPVDFWNEAQKVTDFSQLKKQTLEHWTNSFKPVAKSIKQEKDLCFVGHSLGPLFILHMLDKFNIQLDSAIFVAPFLQKLGKSPLVDYVNKTFYKTDFDFLKLNKLIPISYVLYSTNDPFVEYKFSLEFARKLKSQIIMIKGINHMDSSINMKEFPLVLELCKSRIDAKNYL